MITRHQAGPRLAHAVEYPLSGTMVVTAGETADDVSVDVAAQTGQVLAKLDGLLAQAGTDKRSMVSAYIWLADIGDFAAMNAVWETWVVPGQTPTRACVEAKLADPRIKVEIQVFAVKS
jgi:enamine deaminase RidA (YjgF/YER057c/UK114 family)